MILDSNILIYSALPEHAFLKDYIRTHRPFVSWVSYVEVLGFHRLTAQHRQYFEEFFDAGALLAVDTPILLLATRIRQQKSMSLGDSLLAATARHYDFPLVTRNVVDFKYVPGLRLINPFDKL